MSEVRIVSTKTENTNEERIESSLRPESIDQYIGQQKIKDNLDILMKSAQMRGDVIEHIMLHGPPGLGKTTLARIIAKEMGVGIKTTSGPSIEKAGDLVAILTNLSEGDVLFIDEIHRLKKVAEEFLYPAMEDFRLDVITGKGPAARTFRIDIPKITVIGATTRAGLLSSPLRDRFGVLFALDFYSPQECAQIVKRSAGLLGIDMTPNGTLEIGNRSRGTARIANRLLRRVRDFALVHGHDLIDQDIADQALTNYEIDSLGLDAFDRKILTTLITVFDGGPVGVETLAAMLATESSTIEEVYEPYLMQLGFVSRTPRGRMVTQQAREYIEKEN